MSFLDRLFGRDDRTTNQGQRLSARPAQADPRTPDEIALERYRYMLQTAPPEDIEQAHAEAFAKLTPEQRQLALQQLATALPENEVRSANDDPRSLARLATRAELRQPGTIERAFGGRPQGQGGASGGGMGGFGGVGLGSILLYSIAGSFIGSAIAQSFFADNGYPEGDPGGTAGEAGGDAGDGFATAGDTGATDAGSDGYSSGGSWGDAGTDYGTADAGDPGGGDFGGGDFGGGDFGGGDFG